MENAKPAPSATLPSDIDRQRAGKKFRLTNGCDTTRMRERKRSQRINEIGALNVPENTALTTWYPTPFVTVGLCVFLVKYAEKLNHKPIIQTTADRLPCVGYALSTIAN